MKKNLVIAAAGAIGLLFSDLGHAEFLYQSYLVPSFPTQYSAWDVFYTPYGSPNYPDYAAPYGIYQSATSAGFTPPANSSPSNPFAYWNTNNATITQNGTDSAFIIGPGSTGNIYSFAAPTSFTLDNTVSSPLGTVLFQFQTEGTMVDFSSIKLVYTDGTGTHSLSPEEMLREYRSSSSSFGGEGNRTAVQWDLTGLNITSYQIVWTAAGSSMSFQQAVLDTSSTYGAIIPASRTWNAGNGNWSSATGWSGTNYTSANANGNVNFVNSDSASINLDADHTVGQVTFDTSANTAINSAGGFTLTANTGVTTTSQATGRYEINSKYAFGAFNIFEINSGTVAMNGVISGTYGMLKTGTGTLILANNNTFNGTMAVQGGTLRVEGTNAYTGATAALLGSLVVAADAGSTGALGNATSAITVGEDSATFENVGGGSAGLYIDGNHTISRDILLASGTFQKTLGAFNASGGATYSGTVNLGTSSLASSNVTLSTASSTDRVTFSGAVVGGASTSVVTIGGPGMVIFSGSNKSYVGSTNVSAGTLLVAAGSSFAASGTVTVAGGARLTVDGTMGGTGGLFLNGTLGGSGVVNRAVTAGGILSTISAGTGPGTLTLASLNAASGVNFVFELGAASDQINVSGLLTGSTAAGNITFQFIPESGFQAGVAYTLLTFGSLSGLDVSDFAALSSPGYVLDTSFHDGGWFIDTVNNKVEVQFTAVPEPSTWGMALLGAGLLGWLAAKRKRVALSSNEA